MEATNQTQMNQVAARSGATRGIFGNVSDRTAQVLAVVVTTGVFGVIGYALNALFISLGGSAS